MELKILLQQKNLMLPIAKKQPKRLMEIFINDDKKLELQIPFSEIANDQYKFDFYAPLNLQEFLGSEISLVGEFSETFFKAIKQSEIMPKFGGGFPKIHFKPLCGWMNDPNGLVYQNGVYHMYFQYNPFDTEWDNMSWGHAVSHDLLHWEQLDTVMYPDCDGAIYSGCGLRNDGEALGLSKDTLLFFYTSAGGINNWSKEKEFTQKLAYSTDGGQSLTKSAGWILPTVCKENRDPKIFRHEPTNNYIMVLWLENNDFGIFTSPDLLDFKLRQRLTLEDAFECPDLLELAIEGTDKTKWIFWSADGFYYLGDFDGYTFQTDSKKLAAYCTKMPYAAQTFSGISDRIVSVPWLRTENKDCNYHGVMGIPREIFLRQTADGLRLVQQPVRELNQYRKKLFSSEGILECSFTNNSDHPIEIHCSISNSCILELDIFSLPVIYNKVEKTLVAGETVLHDIYSFEDLCIIIDGEIVEIFGDFGLLNAVVERKTAIMSGDIQMHCTKQIDMKIYEITENKNQKGGR